MAFKIAFVGLDHVHVNQMAHSFLHSGEDYEFPRRGGFSL